MGKISNLSPVKLIAGLIYKNESIFKKTEWVLRKRFGEMDFKSAGFPFDYTDYYEKEFGKGLKRRFISFKKLINPKELPKIKILSNDIEEEFSKNAERLINIDPGYIDFAKLILASTKDYSHRIYLGKGIYAEITLVFRGKSFKPWPWTYPDYRTREYIAIFNKIREIYGTQIKKGEYAVRI